MRRPLLQRWAPGGAWALRCCEPPLSRCLLHAWLLLLLPPDPSWLQGLQVRGLAPWLPSTIQLGAVVVVEVGQPALPPKA